MLSNVQLVWTIKLVSPCLVSSARSATKPIRSLNPTSMVPLLLTETPSPESMRCNSILRFQLFTLRRTFLAVLVALAFTGSMLRAQDAIRPSLAGEAAAEARRQSLDRIPYNLLAGPIRFRFSATMGVEYNDNINIAERHEQDDFIFRPQVNLNALWPIT